MPREEPSTSTSVPGLGGVVAISRSSTETPAAPNGGGGGGPGGPANNGKDKRPKVKTLPQQAQSKVKEVHSKVGDLRTILAKINMVATDEM